jgi:hypothetical protein
MAEETIMTLARNNGVSCYFVDFSAFNSRYYNAQYSLGIEEIQKSLPRLAEDGVPFEYSKVPYNPYLSHTLLVLKLRYYLSYLRRRMKNKIVSTKSTSLCAVLTK